MLPWLTPLLNLPIELLVRFSTQCCMALWLEQRLSWKLHLMMCVPLLHVLCIVFLTLHLREWLLEHWCLDVTWMSTSQFTQMLQPSLQTNSCRPMHACCARINDTHVMNVRLDSKSMLAIISCQLMSWSKLGLDPFWHCVSMQMALSPFNMNKHMSKFLFAMLSQLWLKISHFPQNGLVWVCPPLLGRFGVFLEICSS